MADAYLPLALTLALAGIGATAARGTDLVGSANAALPPPPPMGTVAAYAPSLVSTAAPLPSVVVHANPPRTLPPEVETAIVARARQEVARGVKYDRTYRLLPTYPNGDIPADRGACTDLVIRAFRAASVDLQVLVHEDVVGAPEAYEILEVGDANVDHRRVPTMWTYFTRNALSLETDPKKATATFRPGDVLFYAWKKCHAGWPCIPEHVAMVSDRIGPRGYPLVLQNGGPRASETDSLDKRGLVGHFRLNRSAYSVLSAPAK